MNVTINRINAALNDDGWIRNYFDNCLFLEDLPPLSATTRHVYERHNLCSFQDMRWITKVHRTAIAAYEMTPIELLYTGYLKGLEENFFDVETKPYQNVRHPYLNPGTYKFRMGDRSAEFGFEIPDCAPHHFYEWFHIPRSYISMHEFYNLLDINAIDFLHHGYRQGIIDGRANTMTYPPEEINQLPTFIYPKKIATFLKQNCPGFAPAGYVYIQDQDTHVHVVPFQNPANDWCSLCRSTEMGSPLSVPSSPGTDPSPSPGNLLADNDLEIVQTPPALQSNSPLRLGSMSPKRSTGPVLARFTQES